MEGNTGTRIKALVKGVLAAYAITAIIFLAYAMLITYTDMSEKNIPIVVAVTTLIAVVTAGYDAARGAGKGGWLWGMGAGTIYIVILAAIMMAVLKDYSIDSRTVLLIALAIAGGGLGGIVGINVKTKKAVSRF